MSMQLVPVLSLLLDKGIQTRLFFREDSIGEYAELYRAQGNTALPPLLVIRGSKGQHWVVDGFHRTKAGLLAKLDTLPAEVKSGTYRDAMLLACTQNKHGQPLTLDEKKHLVWRLLNDAEWSQWSANEIGRHCGVSGDMVGRLRAQMPNKPEIITYQDKFGLHHRVRAAHVGRKRTRVAKPSHHLVVLLNLPDVGVPTDFASALQAVCGACGHQVFFTTEQRGQQTSLGKHIQQARQKRGISQAQLAAQSGVPQSTIAGLEIGLKRRTAPATLRKLAAVFGVSVADLTEEHGAYANH